MSTKQTIDKIKQKLLSIRKNQVNFEAWDNLVWEINRPTQMYDAETNTFEIYKHNDEEVFWYKNVYEVDYNTLYIVGLADVNLQSNLPRAITRYYNKKQHTKIVLDYSMESPIMWPMHLLPSRPFTSLFRKSNEVKTFFQVIHEIIKQTNLPFSLFELYIANPFVVEMYDQWRDKNNINDILFVGYRELWALKTVQEPVLAKYVKEYNNSKKTHYYTCFNSRPRSHRIQMLAELYDSDVLDKGITTFIFDGKTKRKLQSTRPELAAIIPKSIENDISFYETADTVPTLDQYYIAAQCGYYDIITETQVGLDYNMKLFKSFFKEDFWQNCFFTEKVWRCVMLRKPFLLVGNSKQLAGFRSLGFKTFDMLFDETYDNIEDEKERVSAVALENKRIIDTYSLSELHNIINSPSVREVVEHNYNRIFEFVNQYAFDVVANSTKNLSKLSNPNDESFKGHNLYD